ncbi:MAG: transporter [Paracoccaceae bacterium]
MNLKSLSHVFAKLLLIQMLIGITFPNVAAAQGEGPRAYQLVPKNTQTVAQFALALRGNQTPTRGLNFEGAEIGINLGITQYGRTFSINGHQAGLLAIVPYGGASGSVSTAFGAATGSDIGLGDVMLGFVYGIVGSPDLTAQEYVNYDPGFAMAFLARATLPTGSYDSNRNLNMGGNRFAFEFGLPIMYYIGSSYLDPSLASIEIFPKVTVFSENSDAPGAIQSLKQAPIFSIEGHVTRNFGQAFWGAFDVLYEYGGETSSDGVSDGNTQRSLSLGVTAALNISQSSSVKISYGEVVSGNAAGSRGQMLRLQYLTLF